MIHNWYTHKYCNDDITKIENYEQAINDTTQTWHCHHRLETDLNLSIQELKDRDLYYNRPASELIFLTPKEHQRIHHKGAFMSEETRKKMSEAKKGKPSNNKGNHYFHSKETKQKISEANKGRQMSEEQKRKLSNSIKGRIYINNGQTSKMINLNELDYYISLGYIKGKIKT